MKISQVPLIMQQAILAAEDDRFYQHGGIDYMGVARAILSNLSSVAVVIANFRIVQGHFFLQFLNSQILN